MTKKVIERIFCYGLKNILKSIFYIPFLPITIAKLVFKIPILVFKSMLGD